MPTEPSPPGATGFAESLLVRIIDSLPTVLLALLILALGWWLARLAGNAIGRLIDRQSRIDPTLRGVATGLVHYAILVMTIIAALGQVGVAATSALAVLGAAGLAIGLALQGTLANVAAGIMLLWLRPFRIGDTIEAGPVCGTVREVGLFASELHSPDGVYLFVPNSELWNKRLANYSRLPARAVELKIAVPKGGDLEATRRLLAEAAAADARVLREPPAQVFISGLSETATELTLRVWAPAGEHAAVRQTLLEAAAAGMAR